MKINLVKYFGGKFYLCNKIIELFPEHNTYVEPFGGGASVLLNKAPSLVEIYNDLDLRIYRLFKVIREHPNEFIKLLNLTPYHQAEFNEILPESTDEIELARRDFVKWRMSMGGMGKTFSYSLHRSRRKMADVVSGYLTSIDEHLPKIIQRLSTVQFLNMDGLDVIKKWDSANTLFYLDPPYVVSTRKATSVYNQEMPDEKHKELCKILKISKGKVVLSGYDNNIYKSYLQDWNRKEFDLPNNSSKSKSKERRTEVLWMNF